MLAKLVRAYQVRFPYGAGSTTPPITLDERMAMDRPTMHGYIVHTEKGGYQHTSRRPLYTYKTQTSVTLYATRPWEADLVKEDARKAALLHMVRDQNGIGCEGLAKWRHVVLELPAATFHVTVAEAETGDTIRMQWVDPLQ